MLSLHLAALLFGMAGLLSKFLSASATTIVWGRATFAVLATLAYMVIRRQRPAVQSRADGARLAAQGIVLALHWVAFFHSIQISSVAIGLLSVSTFPAFVLLLEVIFLGERVRWTDVAGIALIFLGLGFIVPEFDLDSTSLWGVLWGSFSGFLFAVLTLMNRRLSGRYEAAQISLVQCFVAALVLTPWVVPELGGLGGRDWLLLAVLGVFCTALAHTLFIHSLSKVRAFVASIVASIEPVYGIAGAFLLLGEQPLLREIVGGVLILAAAAVITLRSASPSATPLP